MTVATRVRWEYLPDARCVECGEPDRFGLVLVILDDATVCQGCILLRTGMVEAGNRSRVARGEPPL